MDVDDHLRGWADHVRAVAQGIKREFDLTDPRTGSGRRSHAVALVTASMLLVIGLVVALTLAVTRGSSHGGLAPTTHAGAPPADLSRRVECGSIPFRAGQLSGPTIDLAGSIRGDVVALRRTLTEGDGALGIEPGGYSGRRWYAVRPNSTSTLFLTHGRGMRHLAVTVTRLNNTWKADGTFGCLPARIIANRSLGVVVKAAPSPSSNRTLLIQAAPMGPCGTPERAAQFHVTYAPTWIAIIITYPPPSPQGHDCVGHSTPPFALQLNSPIGNRSIYNDGFLRPSLIEQNAAAPGLTGSPIPKTPVR